MQQLQQVAAVSIATAAFANVFVFSATFPSPPPPPLAQQVDDVHAISKLFVVPASAKQAFVSARVAQLMPEIPQGPPADDRGHVTASQ
jgi:hypothetical protein